MYLLDTNVVSELRKVRRQIEESGFGPRRFPLRAFTCVRSQYWNWRYESSSLNGVTENR
jgi:hypothetical protein